jgi:hypothetical protein
MDANLKMVEDIARISVDNTPLILVKPTGGDNHGGGVQIDKGSDEYNALQTLVDKIKNPPSCGDADTQTIQGIALLSPGDTFRKAAINLGGRLPTPAEEQAVTSDDALDAAMDGLMKEDTFLERIREMFNDSILTDRWDRGNDGLYLVDEKDFPNIKTIKDGDYMGVSQRQVAKALAREPLNLIAYVVQQDRPISEMLTAPYVAVNPFDAAVYGVSGYQDPTNENEFKEVQLNTYDNGKGSTAIPHAGVLTTNAFLNRWPTTPTNRSRGRARQVYKSFMAFNVLKLSERPVDASKVSAVDNPTMNSPLCKVCHQVIDPVAGDFRGWREDGDYAHFSKGADWHVDMRAPGFGTTQLPPESYDGGLQWLAQQIVADPRFAISVVRTVYTGITGHEPLAYPTDPTQPDFKDQLAAWDAQDSFFRSAVQALTDSNMNLKAVVKKVVKSPYFRAATSSNPRPAQNADIGTGHLLTPEMLNRKIHAVTGVYWGYFDGDGNRRDWLNKETYQNYFIFYGGMDSDSVITHLKQPNGTVAAVAGRMANEMSCALTAWDFTKPADQRTFFTVDPTLIPESAGNEVPASVTAIKKNIAQLHHRFWGDQVDENSPEVQRTYQLFLDTYRELLKNDVKDIPYWCQGRWDRVTGQELPDKQVIDSDPNHTIQAWQAVMAYLMMDYKFIYE